MHVGPIWAEGSTANPRPGGPLAERNFSLPLVCLWHLMATKCFCFQKEGKAPWSACLAEPLPSHCLAVLIGITSFGWFYSLLFPTARGGHFVVAPNPLYQNFKGVQSLKNVLGPSLGYKPRGMLHRKDETSPPTCTESRLQAGRIVLQDRHQRPVWNACGSPKRGRCAAQ